MIALVPMNFPGLTTYDGVWDAVGDVGLQLPEH